MYRQLVRIIKKRFGRKHNDINPEDIFLDSSNLPGYTEHRFHGRIEKPMGRKTFLATKIAAAMIMLGLASKLLLLGVVHGDEYAEISENNRLEHTLIFANRGTIYDRNMEELATNVIKTENEDFAGRSYATTEGLAHVVGYLKYPLQDKAGFYYEESYKGRDGVERTYDEKLQGENGLKLRETNVLGELISESVVKKPQDGESLVLSIDSKLTDVLYKAMKNLSQDRGFVGGAGVIMDVHTGEILAMTSFPEYNQSVLTEGTDRESINSWVTSSSKPFLNRAIGGLYTPGSVLKPIVALAALNEKIISPEKEILSTGSIRVENPYDKTKPSIFKDWKAHGWTDMREALAVSSDTYFYTIGGGYQGQAGLGITAMDRYFEMFGLKDKTGVNLLGEVEGVIPTPAWKKEKFNGEIWRLGDTYITSIGQYGTQVTPINVARFIASLANGGKLLKPSLMINGEPNPVVETLTFNEEDLRVVREGMRAAVTYGTSVGLNTSYVKAAAKTGTAEVGSSDEYVNSWSVGFFPFDEPKYAWAVVMEKGPSFNPFGATAAVRQVFDWMIVNTPQYF